MSIQVDLGPEPAKPRSNDVVVGLRQFLEADKHCDVTFTAHGQSFSAHRAALAAAGPGFVEYFKTMASDGAPAAHSGPSLAPLVLSHEDIAHAQAFQFMIDSIYGKTSEYNPSGDAVNSDVIRLAQRYQIAQLQAQASEWLLTGVTAENVLARLQACEEAGLVDVKDKLLNNLVADPELLYKVASSSEVTQAPVALQELLVKVLFLLGVGQASDSTAGAKRS